MISFLKKNYQFLLICVTTLIIYYPSLFTFFTNDDFYFLRITRQISLSGFINSFNIFVRNQDGFGVYRPLTTQLFYLLNNSLSMHVVVFATFFIILYLMYKFGLVLFNSKKMVLISVFLYSVSATHFGHFYYLATFQELGATLFILLTLLTHLNKNEIYSCLFFVAALMCKETAIITPFLIILIDWYFNNKLNWKKYVTYFIVLTMYLYSHFYLYGMATGDTYIWDFGIRKLLNTTGWYLLWSLNIPETFIDFVGPSFRINPNLFVYWSGIVYKIIALFVVEVVLIAVLVIKNTKIYQNKTFHFSSVWFFISLAPVIFLPLHKFTFYLTLPLIGVVYFISHLIKESRFNTLFIVFFLCVWTGLSIFTVRHSINTSWITQGVGVSKRVYEYIDKNRNSFYNGIVFIDTAKDVNLPWSPTSVVKTALSDKNFFAAFYPEIAGKINYYNGDGIKLISRQFLGY